MQDAHSANAGSPASFHRSPVAFLTVIAGTVLAALILSVVYGPIEHYSPIIYLNLILAVLFGCAVGSAGRFMMKRERVHGKAAALCIGIVGGAAAIAFAWLAYLWAVTDYDFSIVADIINEPQSLKNIVQYLAENPIWTIESGKNSQSAPAYVYYATWILEGAAIMAMAVRGCWDFVAENALCAECGDWMAYAGDKVRYALPEDDATGIRTALSVGDLTVLPGLKRMADDSEEKQWLEVKRFSCPNCSHRNEYATVTLVKLKAVKNKEPERSEKRLTGFIELDASLKNAFSTLVSTEKTVPASNAEVLPE